jgi:cytochrome c55X
MWLSSDACRLAMLAMGLVMVSTVTASLSAEPTAERQQELRHLLKHDCGSCHGMTLKGGLGPALLPENLSSKSDEVLKQTILHGRPPTPMPPWSAILSEEDIEWLVMLLRRGEGDV